MNLWNNSSLACARAFISVWFWHGTSVAIFGKPGNLKSVPVTVMKGASPVDLCGRERSTISVNATTRRMSMFGYCTVVFEMSVWTTYWMPLPHREVCITCRPNARDSCSDKAFWKFVPRSVKIRWGTSQRCIQVSINVLTIIVDVGCSVTTTSGHLLKWSIITNMYNCFSLSLMGPMKSNASVWNNWRSVKLNSLGFHVCCYVLLAQVRQFSVRSLQSALSEGQKYFNDTRLYILLFWGWPPHGAKWYAISTSCRKLLGT